MPTQKQVLDLLQRGLDYPQAARELGVPPGLAYLIATGLPADGGDTVTAAQRRRPGFRKASQALAHPPAENPTGKEEVHRWLRARATGDAALRHAHRTTDLTPPPPQHPEIVEATTVLGRAHNRVNRLLKRLKALPGPDSGATPLDLARRRGVADLVAAELAAHEAAEQRHLWPTVRARLPGGEQLASEGERQEREGDRILDRLAATDPTAEEFGSLVAELVTACRKHVAFEDTVFAQLRHTLSQGEREALGRALLDREPPAAGRPPAPEADPRDDGK